MNAPANKDTKVRMEFAHRMHALFIIEKKGRQMAELDVEITDDNIIVNHMEVAPKHKSQLQAKLLASLVEYAREHYLKIVSLNKVISRKLNKQPDKYADIWMPTDQ